MLDILLEVMQREENSILFSTHITSDLDRVADYITFIHKGSWCCPRKRCPVRAVHAGQGRAGDLTDSLRRELAGVSVNEHGFEAPITRCAAMGWYWKSLRWKTSCTSIQRGSSMAVNIMIREWKALLYDPRMMLLTFGTPFLFWFFLPGFNGGAFPAVLVAYVLLGLSSSRGDAKALRASLTQFPVTIKDHVTGLFLFQAVAVLFTGTVAVAFMQVVGAERFMADVLPKALGWGCC